MPLPEGKITGHQLKRLQTLYSQLSRHTLEGGSDRAARIAWASQQVGRSIASFKDLKFSEAKALIDGLQQQLGVKAPAKKRERLSRDAARQAGTEGRRDGAAGKHTLVSGQDLARIDHALTLLGWDRAGLERWLSSPRSPLGKRSSPEIRTLGDANKVWWALKRMAIARGVWEERKTA